MKSTCPGAVVKDKKIDVPFTKHATAMSVEISEPVSSRNNQRKSTSTSR